MAIQTSTGIDEVVWDLASDLCLLVLADGEIVRAGRAGAEALGHRPEELVGRRLFDGMHPDDRPGANAAARRLLAGHAPLEDVPARWRTGDGAWRRMRWTARAIGGGLVVVVGRDDEPAAPPRSAAPSRPVSVERFRHAFEAAPIGMALSGPDGALLLVNEAFAELVRRTEDELRGQRFAELLDPEDRTRLDARVAELARGVRRRHRSDMRLVRSDGRVTWACVAVSAARDASGRARHLVWHVEDVDQRRRAEEALRASEERLEAIVENTPAALYVKDLDGRYLLVNQVAAQLLGAEPAELLGRTDADALPSHVAERVRATDLRVVREACSLQVEEVIPHGDGELTLLAVKFPLRDATGRIHAVGGVATDITERVRADAERDRLRARAEQVDRLESLGRLAGGIAHDFNNLLAVIANAAAFAADEVQPGSRAAEDVAAIREAAGQAASLTQQLLIFGRRQASSPEPLDLNRITEDSAPLLRRTLGDDVELELELAAEPVVAEIDRSQVEQLLANLALNAGEAMRSGGRLTIATGRDGAWATLLVADTGEGMPAEVAERAFDPFFTTRGREGTGLGLAIVWSVASRAGGQVSLHTRPGEGTEVLVRLPASARPAAHAPPGDLEALAGDGTGTVLVVEDDANVRRLTARTLREHGYEVLEAADGEAAVRLCREHPGPLHLLLADVVLAGASGPEVAEQAQAQRPGLPVLYVSGYAPDVVAHHAAGAGDALLRKPFDRETLLAAVARTARRPRA